MEEAKKIGGKYDEWDIKCCADKMLEVEELKKDEEKLKYVMEELEGRSKAIKSIADLRKKYKEMPDDEGSEEES